MKNIADDIKFVLNIEEHLSSSEKKNLEGAKLESRDYDSDDALPGFLWDPDDGFQKGGLNFNDISK